MKVINKTPKKLSDLNDITRLKEIYTCEGSLKLPKYVRQNIILQKFKNTDLDFIYDQYCSQNVFGSITLPKVHENRAKAIARKQGIKVTLRRLPNVSSFEHADTTRFSYFTKKIWDDIYDGCTGYTIVFVPNYFDFIKLRTFIKNKNA